MKGTALGKGVDALFEVTKPEHLDIIKEKQGSKLPKFRTFEIKLSILLKANQLDYLNKFEKKIMINRSSQNKKERITKNSIIRCAVDLLSKLDIDTKEIADERELSLRVNRAVLNDRS
ncbi:MAG: hypothetical protein QME07_02815 [bacterium]|nr:hypothetical protein [bacterium]